MPTFELARKIEPTRPAATTSAPLVQAILALCFALVVVVLVMHPTIDDPDSPVFSVAGP